MKRTHLIPILGLLAAIAFIASCDQRTPVMPIGGGSSSGTPGKPTVSIDTVQPNPVNVGDSILVAVHIHDDAQIQSSQILGLTVKGDPNLGTLTTANRYSPANIPASGPFRTGLRDTVVRRYLQPAQPVDTTLDSLVIIATATDNQGNKGADTVVVRMVSGPSVSFITPQPTTPAYASGDMSILARATHVDGVARIDIGVKNVGTWPTPVNYSTTRSYTSAPKDTTLAGSVSIPANAPVGGRITFTASAIDINGKPGSQASLTLTIRATDTVPPLVTQIVSPRIELTDSVSVSASGSSGITTLGVVVSDSVGTLIRQGTLTIANPLNSIQAWVPLPLTNAEQGKHLRISSFATDRNGRTGYSVPVTVTTPQQTAALAWFDTTVVVYGRTYPLPNSAANTLVGDIAVDTARGNVFVSNINANRLDVWQGATRSFSPTGVPVGSQPWGLAVGNSPDTLYVANSGGTNISRVFIGSTSVANIREVLAQRILTRNTYLFVVTEARDINTGKITLSVQGPISYSDRPQYIGVSKAGRVYYSTRTTPQAPAGTIRWLDPSLPVPDPRQIWQYGSSTGSATTQFALFNVDSVGLLRAPANSPNSDILTLYDHPYGQAAGTVTATDSSIVNAVVAMNGGGSDAEVVLNLDVGSLALSDTTFIGISGDRSWVAFGEGNTSRPGRIMLVNDPSGSMPGFFSPGVAVADLLDNASEHVFGVAVDSSGITVASHGNQSYFAEINSPFHLRLQGKFDSFDNGAGVAFHPNANGFTSSADTRLAFVASQSGFIEIVDIAYFLNRGKLTIKGNLYGPLKASRPFATDPPGTVLKLFGLTNQGLVVIDLTAADIRPAP